MSSIICNASHIQDALGKVKEDAKIGVTVQVEITNVITFSDNTELVAESKQAEITLKT